MRVPGIHPPDGAKLSPACSKTHPGLCSKPTPKPAPNSLHFQAQFLGSILPDPGVNFGPDPGVNLGPYPIHFEGCSRGVLEGSPRWGGFSRFDARTCGVHGWRRHLHHGAIAVCTRGVYSLYCATMGGYPGPDPKSYNTICTQCPTHTHTLPLSTTAVVVASMPPQNR